MTLTDSNRRLHKSNGQRQSRDTNEQEKTLKSEPKTSSAPDNTGQRGCDRAQTTKASLDSANALQASLWLSRAMRVVSTIDFVVKGKEIKALFSLLYFLLLLLEFFFQSPTKTISKTGLISASYIKLKEGSHPAFCVVSKLLSEDPDGAQKYQTIKQNYMSTKFV